MYEMTLDTTINPKYASVPDAEAEIRGFVAAFDTAGVTIFQNRRNTIKLFTAGSLGMKVVVKRYSNKGLVKKLLSLCKKSKARKAYDNGMLLTAAAIDTPEPIAFMEERSHGCLHACYCVNAFTSDTPLADAIERPTPDADAIRALAALIARLHDNGFAHRDLNLSNVLHHKDADGSLRLTVIDVNRMRHRADGRALTHLADYKEDLMRFTGRLDIFLPVAYTYARLRGFDAEPFVRRLTKKKIKHDADWTRRKKFHRLFH